MEYKKMINFIKKLLLLSVIIMGMGLIIDEDAQGIENDYKSIDNYKIEELKQVEIQQHKGI